ncbi:DHHC palmitoyltransferase-domain-containing protein [Lipomyces arxii]|uniref:DHHC palmitoyltransferase-domain-containing protein n=1 Tax=Lipomyces arxii TaxID=56418 RepID=UPI0034CE957D
MHFSALHYVVTFIVVFSTIVFIVLFGRLPTFKGTLVGRAHILLAQKVPEKLGRIDYVLTGGKLSQWLGGYGHHLVNDKNWAVVIFYSAILTVSLFFFFKDAWQYITSPIHRIFIPPLAFQPYFYLYLAIFTDPGTITASNVSRFLKEFQYDDIIFYKDQQPCWTCHTPKPARSKHCSVCKHCVARMDHHCAWINNCIGYYNYRFFLGFVASNLAMLIYGSYLTGMVLHGEYLRQYFPQGYADAPKWYWADGIKWLRLIHSKNWTAAVSSLCMISTLLLPLVIAFLAQHILFIHQGVTTNESEKWVEVQWAVESGLLYVYENGNPSSFEYDTGSGSGSDGEAVSSVHARNPTSPQSRPLLENSGRRIYIHVYSDNDTNRFIPPGMVKVEKVPDLESIVNIYDKGGFFKNWGDVFWPKQI